jgi:DNA-binding helix-hairpin-helix protein with protein kinase domain
MAALQGAVHEVGVVIVAEGHALSGGVLAVQAPQAVPPALQVWFPEFVMPQTFPTDVQGCVVSGVHVPPFTVTVPIDVGPLAHSEPPFMPVL